MSLLPMAVYGLEVPAGDVAISARPEIPSAFQITMAAIDPSAEPEGEEGAKARATLKIIRQPLILDDSEDDESDDEDDFDPAEMERMLAEETSDDDESEDDASSGPSDPTKTKAARKAAAREAIKKLLEQDEMDVDEAKPNGIKSAKARGKMPASDDEDDEVDEDDSEDDMEGAEIEEFVICTLDPEKQYQQTLNLTIGSDERVWFKVSGTHTIYLTGNYVDPVHPHSHDDDEDDSEYDEDEYDLSPDEDEIEGVYDEEDELDDMEDPRITEIEDQDEAPKLVEATKKADKKGKNKRAAEDDAATSLDAMIAAESKAEPATNGDAKLSKKQLKKLKKNDGTAAAATEEAPSSTKSDKKVQFAKELEQGPTPTKGAEKGKASLGVKTVQGVTLDDKKLGTGPAAKSGDRIGMRYIGKLAKDNKVFDSNKKGKPFSFKLGSGEVIKGWDIGVAGMSVGGERRVTIPAHHGYGSRGAPPDIPPNATLVFDLKVVEINKGK